MTAGLLCGSCGTGLREDVNFSDECGAPTAGSVDTPQYKAAVQAGEGAVRRRGAVDGHRLCCGLSNSLPHGFARPQSSLPALLRHVRRRDISAGQ